MYPYVIFDLDGTLLNTIDDLADAGNHVCRLHGWPVHSVEDFKRMVGNGIPKLVERFAPEGTGAPVLEQALGEFMAWYGVHKEDKTAPYPGMLQAVRQLKEAGVSVAVLSNKADEMAGPVVEGYYPKSFPLVQGALPGVPTKPDPTLLHRLMERMGASARIVPMTNMETGTVQLLTEATALSRKPGRDTGAAIRSSPAKTAMMQGWRTSLRKASFLLTLVKRDSPAVHMVKRSGIWNMDV